MTFDASPFKKSRRVTFASIITLLTLVGTMGVAAALTASGSTASSSMKASTTSSPSTAQPVTISQALPGQGSIVGGALIGTSTSAMLASTASTTAGASTTVGLGIPSEHNRLSLSGSCVVTTSTNQKTCNMSVSYTSAAGQPVIGIPITLATMNAEGSFTSVTGPLLVKNAPGKVIQYSGRLAGNQAQDVASFIVSADATNTLFVALTPDGLRAQSNFASSTVVQ